MINASKHDIIKTDFIDELYIIDKEDITRETKQPTDNHIIDSKKEEEPQKVPLLILVSPNLNAIDKAFLIKVMSSVGVQENAFILSEHFNDKIVGEKTIFFGEREHYSASFSLDPYSMDKKNILICDELNAIQSDQNKKRLLWEALKTMFSINS